MSLRTDYFQVPVLWDDRLLGWVQGGYIVQSNSKQSSEEVYMYDMPESGSFGILQLLPEGGEGHT